MCRSRMAFWCATLLFGARAVMTACAEDPNDVVAKFVALIKSEDHAGVVAIADKALPMAEQMLRDAPENRAIIIGKVAGSHMARGEFTQAEPLCRRALDICEKSLGPEHPATARSLNSLAELYRAKGRYAEARPMFERALAILQRSLGPDNQETATSLVNLAALYRQQGQYALAEPLYERALSTYEKTLGPDHRYTATILNNLAELSVVQGQYARAEPLYKRALAISEKGLGPDHPDTATSLNNLAELYRVQGEYAKAEPLLERAVAIYEKARGPDHPATATILDNLAGLHESQGRYADAEPIYERSLAIREKVFGPDHPATATSLHNLAHLFEVDGQHARAESLSSRAVVIFEKTFGPDHPNTVTSLVNLAALQAALGRWADAAGLVDRSRRGARRHVARVLPSLSAAEQAAFLQTQDRGNFRIALTLGLLQKSSPQVASLSAGWLANGKAVAQEAASQRIVMARESTDPATMAAVTTLEKVRGDLAKLCQAIPKPTDVATHRERITQLQAEERRLVHAIGGQLAAVDREEPWVEIDAIRRNIPAGSVLVDIARFKVFDFDAKGKDEKWQPARYVAWIVPPTGAGDVTILDLGEAEAIDAAVAAYRTTVAEAQRGFPRGQATAEDELKVAAAPLASKVLQPIVGAIGTATDIIVSPDGPLWLVPWQALPLADGSYAIERFSMRTVTSARDLVPVPVDAKGGTGGPVVVADPVFDAAGSGKGAADGSRSASPVASAQAAAFTFERLASTRSEALATKAAISRLAGSEPRMLLGADASEANVKQAARRPRTLVLATHGFFLKDQEPKKDDAAGPGAGGGGRSPTRAVSTTGEPLEDPLLRCGLALAGANAGAKAGGDDGILTGAEIVGLDLLGTDLVVLSACETGVGKVRNGEGVAGLRQAFQIAGAKSVVATLWQVPDQESAAIMAGFYANLARGQSASQALREAQLAFIKARREDRNYEAAHPYLWAAYGVTGR